MQVKIRVSLCCDIMLRWNKCSLTLNVRCLGMEQWLVIQKEQSQVILHKVMMSSVASLLVFNIVVQSLAELKDISSQ